MQTLFKAVSLARRSEVGIDKVLLEMGRRNGVGWAGAAGLGAVWGQRIVADEAEGGERVRCETCHSQPWRRWHGFWEHQEPTIP